jgi:hypothetical protein
MELFLPSLFLILIVGIFVFLLVPRTSPFIIFVLCVVFLFISIKTHYEMFNQEYKNLILTDILKQFPGLIIVIISIGIIVAVLNLFTGYGFKISMTNLKLPSIKLPTKNPLNYKNIPIEQIKELEKQL